MATINICDYIDVFKKSRVLSTSYEIYRGDTGEVIASNYKDPVNLTKWTSELSDGNGGHYRYEKDLRARAKFHYFEEESNWFEVGQSYDQVSIPQPIHTCNIKGDNNG